jgi:hypothetical protein
MRQGQMLAAPFFASLVAISATAPAHADMLLISRDTGLSASGLCGAGDTTCTSQGGVSIGRISDSTQGFAPYSNVLNYFSEARAEQESSVSTTQISAATIITAQPATFGQASSSFTLKFSLSAPEAFTLSGFSTGTGSSQSESGLSGPESFLLGSGATYQGVLSAGTYTLFADGSGVASGPMSAFAEAQVNLTLTPVPLPNSFYLGIAGILVLLGAEKYRRMV